MEFSITQSPPCQRSFRKISGLGPVKEDQFFQILSKTLFLATIAISKIFTAIGNPVGQFWTKQQANEEQSHSGSEITILSEVANLYPKADIS